MTNQPIGTVRSPQDIARVLGPQRPATPTKTPAQHDNGYKGQDRRGGLRFAADLARADAVKDTVEITPTARLAAQAQPCGECGRPTLGAFGPAPQHNYWRTVCQSCKDKADNAAERVAVGLSAKLDSMVRKSVGLPVNEDPHEARERAANVAPAPGFSRSDAGAGAVSTAAPATPAHHAPHTDLGDGLGLPVPPAAHNGVEGDLASEGERPFILSAPVQTEIGATFRRFFVRTSRKPTAEELSAMQTKLGYPAGGYGPPSGIKWGECDGAISTTWYCDRSCD